jgi:hypothetical protein
MHPILGNLRRLIPYLLGWLPLSGMLVYLLAVPGGLTWMEAFALGIPLCLLYGFMCLSAWYSCRWTPLDRAGALRRDRGQRILDSGRESFGSRILRFLGIQWG